MQILIKINKELLKNAEPIYRASSYRFFKERVKILGVRTPVVRKIADKYFKEIYHRPKRDIFSLAEKLLKQKDNEHKTVGFAWLYKIKKQLKPRDFSFLENCLKKYVSNWGSCDDFCCHTLGYFLYTHPQFLSRTKIWAKSKNRWLRRAAAVSLIYSLRNGKNLKQAFKICDILLKDNDDLVQKGYGWSLKEASRKFQKQVFNYVAENKKMMPRTALRYAIEKMPENLKIKARER